MNCQDWIMTSRTASTHTKGKNGEISLWPWTRRQMWPSCGELLKELMEVQNARQITKLLPLAESRSHRPSSLPPSSTNSSTRQRWEDTRETKRKSLEMAPTFTTLRHDLSDSGDMEVFIDHPNTKTWQGHLSRNFISAYLASLSSRESTGVSDSAHYQQIPPACSRPTRF